MCEKCQLQPRADCGQFDDIDRQTAHSFIAEEPPSKVFMRPIQCHMHFSETLCLNDETRDILQQMSTQCILGLWLQAIWSKIPVEKKEHNTFGMCYSSLAKKITGNSIHSLNLLVVSSLFRRIKIWRVFDQALDTSMNYLHSIAK